MTHSPSLYWLSDTLAFPLRLLAAWFFIPTPDVCQVSLLMLTLCVVCGRCVSTGVWTEAKLVAEQMITWKAWKRGKKIPAVFLFFIFVTRICIYSKVRVKSQQPILHIVHCCCHLSVPPDEHQSKTQTEAFLTRWTLPKGGQGCLMSFSCLESQGCHSVSLSYLLSCYSTRSCCSFCFAVFLLILLPFFQKILQSFLLWDRLLAWLLLSS